MYASCFAALEQHRQSTLLLLYEITHQAANYEYSQLTTEFVHHESFSFGLRLALSVIQLQ